jgi:hypothetical protein
MGTSVSPWLAALAELKTAHAADLEKRAGSLKATRVQLQEASGRSLHSSTSQLNLSRF